MLAKECTSAPVSGLRQAMLGLLLLVASAWGAGAGAAESAAVTHLIGTVLDPSGQPAAGALVGARISLNQQQTLNVRSLYVEVDATGRFDLAVPSSLRSVTVVARCIGFQGASSAPIELRAARLAVPPLKLAPGLKLTGRVVDEQRQPIPGASVQVVPTRRGDETIRFVPQRSRSKTLRDGTFEVPGLDAGTVTVSAYSGTHALWSKYPHTLDASPASRLLEITLAKGVFLSGTVLDAERRPLPGARISDSTSSNTLSVSSDARGRFRIGPFQPDMARGLDARLSGYTPLRVDFTPPQSDVVLVLNRNAALRGRVVDAVTQQAVQSFRVSVHSPGGNRGQFRAGAERPRSFNSRDGSFALSDLNAGPWTISVQARGYQPWEKVDFEFQGGVTHDLPVALSKGLTLRGRVIDKSTGKGLAGAQVSHTLRQSFMFEIPNDSTPPPAISDASGAFVIEGLPRDEVGGTVTLRARAPGYQDVIEKLDSGSQAFIELAASRAAGIRGQVVAADGVTPVQARVWLRQGGDSSGSATDSAATDEGGRFEFASQRPGRYRIDAATSTGRSESQEITLGEGEEEAGLILRVSAAATLRGHLSGLSAAELVRARVEASDSGANRFGELYDFPSNGSKGTIDAGGAYQIEGLAGGAIVVGAAARATRIVKKIEVPARGEATVDFDFNDVQVSGRVTRNGRPVPNAFVFAVPREGQTVSATTRANPNGDYTLSNLGRGRYAVGTYGVWSVEIQVGPGVIQNFELAPFDISGRAVDAVTGQGLAEVRVRLLPLTPGGTDHHAHEAGFGLTTSAQGEFFLKEIKAGEYQLQLYRTGYDLSEQRVAVAASVSGLAVALRPAEGVRLRVRGTDGSFLSGVQVNVPSDKANAVSLSVKLDQYGVGRLPPSLVGRPLKIEHGAYESFVVDKWNGAPLDIELRVRAP